MRKFILAVTMTIPLLAAGTLAAKAAYAPPDDPMCHPDPSNSQCENNNADKTAVSRRDQNIRSNDLGGIRSGRVGGNHESNHGGGRGGSHGGGGRR